MTKAVLVDYKNNDDHQVFGRHSIVWHIFGDYQDQNLMKLRGIASRDLTLFDSSWYLCLLINFTVEE